DFAGELCEPSVGVAPVDVAQGDDILAGEIDHVAAPHPADADAGDVESVARRLESAAQHVPRNDGQTGGREADVGNEFPAGAISRVAHRTPSVLGARFFECSTSARARECCEKPDRL